MFWLLIENSDLLCGQFVPDCVEKCFEQLSAASFRGRYDGCCIREYSKGPWLPEALNEGPHDVWCIAVDGFFG